MSKEAIKKQPEPVCKTCGGSGKAYPKAKTREIKSIPCPDCKPEPTEMDAAAELDRQADENKRLKENNAALMNRPASVECPKCKIKIKCV